MKDKKEGKRMVLLIAGIILILIGVFSLFVVLYRNEIFKTRDKTIGYAINSQTYTSKKNSYYKTTYKIGESTYVTIETPNIVTEGERKEFVYMNGKYKVNSISKEIVLSCISIILCGIGIIVLGLV